MSNTLLTKAEEELVSAIRDPLRGLVIRVRSVKPNDREHLCQILLAALGYRNAQMGRRPKVSETMTVRVKRIVRAYPSDVSDRTIAQRHNLAIGDVSEARRSTRR